MTSSINVFNNQQSISSTTSHMLLAHFITWSSAEITFSVVGTDFIYIYIYICKCNNIWLRPPLKSDEYIEHNGYIFVSIFIIIWNESAQFHQYQKSEQSPLISTTEHKKDDIWRWISKYWIETDTMMWRCVTGKWGLNAPLFIIGSP